MKAIVHRAGERFGRLVVLGSLTGSRAGQLLWECRCDCGRVVAIPGADIRRGKTRSCGCLSQESRRLTHRTHGKSATRIYWVWRAMIDRCENPRNKRYADYGGRGVKVCAEWHHFEAFYADMGDPPPGGSLDRVDVQGPYEKRNCRWASVETQSRNRRDNHLIEIGGERFCLIDACRRFGVPLATAKRRLRRGWDPVAAVSQRGHFGEEGAL